MLSLLELLASGRLDGAAPGASEADVLAALGEPDHRSPQGRRGRRMIWKWDALEVTFHDHVVVLIHTEFANEPQPAWLDSSGFSRSTTGVEVEQALHNAGVRVEPHAALTFPGEQHAVSTSGGALIVFDVDGTLWSMSSPAGVAPGHGTSKSVTS